jgi:hypothetical protein
MQALDFLSSLSYGFLLLFEEPMKIVFINQYGLFANQEIENLSPVIFIL